MTVVNLTTSAWTQINSDARRVQFRGGRVLVADSATPLAEDWLVMPEGAVIDLTAAKWGKALNGPVVAAVLSV